MAFYPPSPVLTRAGPGAAMLEQLRMKPIAPQEFRYSFASELHHAFRRIRTEPDFLIVLPRCLIMTFAPAGRRGFQ